MTWQKPIAKLDDKYTHLFVYGTLKRGFHWNHKFLGRSRFISEATTVDPYPLVVGNSGVPYLLGDLPGKGKQIVGEIWSVDSETLQGLDDYEGISKGYYERRPISVTTRGNYTSTAFAYFKAQSSEELANSPTFLSEYTIEMHKAKYKPIRHILVKQEMYLGTSTDDQT